MVMVDSTASPVRLKRRGKGAAHRKKRRNRLRNRSTRLVKTGKVALTPCIASAHFSIRPEAVAVREEVTRG